MTKPRKFIWAWGSQIWQVNIDGMTAIDQKLIYQKDIGTLGDLSKLNDQEILFSDSFDQSIYKMNLQTHDVKKLANGYSPMYIAEQNVILFMQHRFGAASSILMVPQDDFSKPEIIYTGGIASGRPFARIGTARIAFLPRERAGEKVVFFDAGNRAISKLDMGSRAPITTLKGEDDMFCFNFGEQKYDIINIIDMRKTRVDWPPSISPIIYDNQRSQFVVTNEVRRDRVIGFIDLAGTIEFHPVIPNSAATINGAVFM